MIDRVGLYESQKRPLFQHEMPDAEKWNENPLFRDLCVTIVECWDADAEARLSAGLVLTRVEQMSQTLLPTNKRPVPPPQPPRQIPQQQQHQNRHQQPQPTQLTQAATSRNPPQVNIIQVHSRMKIFFLESSNVVSRCS